MRGVSAKAFTMVEVLTVVGVIVTLAATLFAMMGSSKGRAKMVRCASNMNQIGKSLMLYCADHDDRVPPFLNFAKFKGMVDDPGSSFEWRNSLMPYARSRELFFCPEDPFAVYKAGLKDVSQADHRETSYVNSPWLKKHATDDVLDLSLTQVEDPSSSTYLEDDAIAVQKQDRDLVPVTAHHNRPNYLFMDGHVSSKSSK